MDQINTFQLKMNVTGVVDNGEDLIDPQYAKKVQGSPIPEIEWDKKEEDQIQMRTFPVIRRTEQWLQKRRLRKLVIKDSPVLVQNVLSNKSVKTCVAGGTKVKVEADTTRGSKKLLVGHLPTRITRSRTKNKSKKLPENTVVVDLEESPEAENIMTEQNTEMSTVEVGDTEKPEEEEVDIGGSLILANIGAEQSQTKKDAGSSAPHG